MLRVWVRVSMRSRVDNRQAIVIAGISASPLYSSVCTAAIGAPVDLLGARSAAGIPVEIAQATLSWLC
jgi:hypothetical protein